MKRLARWGVAAAILTAATGVPVWARASGNDLPWHARRVELGLRVGFTNNNLGGVLGGVDFASTGLGVDRGWMGRLDYDDWRSGVLWGDNGRQIGRGFALSQINVEHPLYFGGGVSLMTVRNWGGRFRDVGIKLIGGYNLSRYVGVEADLVAVRSVTVLMLGARIHL
ncbi:MAG: hypothetical protein ACP5VE_06970 [Chthonomonadales bacterium]